MKIIRFLIFLLPYYSQAQKIDVDKVDEFNGARIIVTTTNKLNESPRSLAVKTVCYIIKLKLDDKLDTSFTFRFYFETKSVTSCNDDSKIFFKLSNDEVLQFKYTGEYQIYSDDVIATIYFELSSEGIKKILKNKVSKIRIETSNDLYDYTLPDSSISVIGNQIELIKKLLKF